MPNLHIYHNGQLGQATADEVAAARQALGAAAEEHTHTGLMTQAQADKLAGLPDAQALAQDQEAQDQAIAGKMPNTLAGVQAALSAAPAAEQASFRDSVSGGRIAALAKAAKIGVAPLTMSGIGNSIMYTSMPWVAHACAVSGGLLQAYDGFHGVPGNGTAQMLARKLEVPAGADLVAIMECTNDADNGTTMAQHEANMRAMIEFYLGRGQLPFGCFPPPRSDGQPSNIRTFQLGFLDYILCTEYGCPFYFPWRDFVLPDATGGIAPSAGATDNKHPGDDGHRLAGIALWDQMRGASHVLPLAQSNLQAGIGMVSDPLNLSLASWNKWGDATASLVAEAGTPGNWWRLTMTGPADSGFRRDINIAGVGAQVGDILMMTCKARTSGAYVNGYAQLNLKSGQTYTTILPGMYSKASGINATLVQKSRSDVPTSTIPAGATSMLVLGAVTADAPAVIELAQIQVWNLSAVRRL